MTLSAVDVFFDQLYQELDVAGASSEVLGDCRRIGRHVSVMALFHFLSMLRIYRVASYMEHLEAVLGIYLRLLDDATTLTALQATLDQAATLVDHAVQLTTNPVVERTGS